MQLWPSALWCERRERPQLSCHDLNNTQGFNLIRSIHFLACFFFALPFCASSIAMHHGAAFGAFLVRARAAGGRATVTLRSRP
eukprot:m.182629 g.182629  ORF g.182629 m.182629 type:complete len:83 (+) comp14979_c0_seq1:1930-2178(+)